MIVGPCLLLALVTSAGAMAAFSTRRLTWGAVVKGACFMLPAVLLLLFNVWSFGLRIDEDSPRGLRFAFLPLAPLAVATFLVSFLFGARAGIRAADEYRR